jgi:hypothetical protein
MFLVDISKRFHDLMEPGKVDLRKIPVLAKEAGSRHSFVLDLKLVPSIWKMRPLKKQSLDKLWH